MEENGGLVIPFLCVIVMVAAWPAAVLLLCGMNYLCFADSSRHYKFCRSLGRYRFMMVIILCVIQELILQEELVWMVVDVEERIVVDGGAERKLEFMTCL